MAPIDWRGLNEDAGSWKIACIRRRTASSSRPEGAQISRPSNRISPEVGRMRRRTIRSNVDFPDPDSPTIPNVRPFSSRSETSSTAVKASRENGLTPVRKVRDALRTSSSGLLTPHLRFARSDAEHPVVRFNLNPRRWATAGIDSESTPVDETTAFGPFRRKRDLTGYWGEGLFRTLQGRGRA